MQWMCRHARQDIAPPYTSHVPVLELPPSHVDVAWSGPVPLDDWVCPHHITDMRASHSCPMQAPLLVSDLHALGYRASVTLVRRQYCLGVPGRFMTDEPCGCGL